MQPKRKTSPITKALLALAIVALVAVAAYYVVAVYLPAQNQAANINNVIEEQR